MRIVMPATGARSGVLSRLRRACGIAAPCAMLVGAVLTVGARRVRGAARNGSRSGVAPRSVVTGADTRNATFAALADSLARTVDGLTSIPSILPTIGWLSSGYTLARYHPILHVSRPHDGLDIAAPMGAPVVAPAAGVVVAIDSQGGYGLLVAVDHGHGVVTRYAHLSRVHVRVGQTVTRGQLLANVGNSGLSTGPHLHYEIRVGGTVVDPLRFTR
jgi:murein DD-endopeptidase MepM/ murein hydrolase activator NlpD